MILKTEHNTYMNWSLEIWIRKEKIYDTITYIWEIKYTSPSTWKVFIREIPTDINRISFDLSTYLDIEAAKIIYEEIADCYIDTFVGAQIEDGCIKEGDVGHNTATCIQFPPFWDWTYTFANDISDLICCADRQLPNIYGELNLEMNDTIPIISMDEYDAKRDNNSLDKDIYLVYKNR